MNPNKSTDFHPFFRFCDQNRKYLRHTAGLNISGSFLLGVLSAMPTVDIDKINQFQSNKQKPFERLQGLSPRAKLMLGVGMYLFLPSTFCGMFTVTHSSLTPRSSHSNIVNIYGSGFCGR